MHQTKLNGEILETVDETKLLGTTITSDLKRNKNTSHIFKKAYARMWIIRRLKMLGASRSRLIDVLQTQVLLCVAACRPSLGLFPYLPGKDRLGESPENWPEDHLGKIIYYF